MEAVRFEADGRRSSFLSMFQLSASDLVNMFESYKSMSQPAPDGSE